MAAAPAAFVVLLRWHVGMPLVIALSAALGVVVSVVVGGGASP